MRWSLKPENNYGFTNCALDNSIWLFKGNGEGTYEFKKVADTGALPADLRQSPDDKYLYVSCFGDNLIQQWDVSDPEHPQLKSTVAPCVQPNMMHVTGDGKRMYVSNSLLSHARPLGAVLRPAGPRRPRRHEGRPVLQHRPEQVSDRAGARARHADQLMKHNIRKGGGAGAR